MPKFTLTKLLYEMDGFKFVRFEAGDWKVIFHLIDKNGKTIDILDNLTEAFQLLLIETIGYTESKNRPRLKIEFSSAPTWGDEEKAEAPRLLKKEIVGSFEYTDKHDRKVDVTVDLGSLTMSVPESAVLSGMVRDNVVEQLKTVSRDEIELDQVFNADTGEFY